MVETDMTHQVLNDDGRAMDAHADLDPTGISFHSRGGSAGSGNVRNSEYGPALRLLLRRIASYRLPLETVWVDSSRVQSIPLEHRTVLRRHELDPDGSSAFSLISTRMTKVGQAEGQMGGNPTKKLRLQFGTEVPLPLFEARLGLVRVSRDLRALDRLPADELNRVTATHIWHALEKLRAPGFQHPFGPSTDFDLVTDTGERFPPKAVFGVAASEALGFEVLPKHFSGGVGTICFSALLRAGYEIVRKTEQPARPGLPITEEDRGWTEGRPHLVTHLRRERASGLAQAKKDNFIQQHGKLYCEECSMDPVEVYGGLHGLACIEVHHHATQVGDMADDHRTKLEDLQCLCANCHRVAHREMKMGLG